jgi:serine/threonine protein kinase
MTKEEKISILVDHFNKYDSNYFIKNISIDNIDYSKFFNCLLKSDIIGIYTSVMKDISPSSNTVASKSTSNKTDYISVLNTHFSSKDIKYFLNKISSIDINYKNYLKCLSSVNINYIYNNVKKDITSSKQPPNTSKQSPNTPSLPPNTPSLPPNTSKQSTPAKTTDSVDFLPFTTKRIPQDLNAEIERIKSYRRNAKKQQGLMQLAQLFQNDIITIRSNHYNYILQIQIINYLSLRDDTLLYIGKVLNSPDTQYSNIPNLKDKNVVVKVQPRSPAGLKSNIAFQITTEQATMMVLQRDCKDILIPQSYAYGLVEPLINGDLERYILVSELLGRDLSKSLKQTSVANIKKNIILALKAVQKMHKCNYIHLDIKHENIVFSDSTEKEIKVIDFGLAESIYNRNNERNIVPRKPGEGSPLYMATMQHNVSVKDFMDDLQAFAWMLLDLLGDKPIIEGMPWYGLDIKKIYEAKSYFIANYKNHNDPFISSMFNGTLNKNNINVIGEIAEYTINRADKSNKYNTDLKTSTGLYFTEYNEQYYTDIEHIINKLS